MFTSFNITKAVSQGIMEGFPEKGCYTIGPNSVGTMLSRHFESSTKRNPISLAFSAGILLWRKLGRNRLAE